MHLPPYCKEEKDFGSCSRLKAGQPCVFKHSSTVMMGASTASDKDAVTAQLIQRMDQQSLEPKDMRGELASRECDLLRVDPDLVDVPPDVHPAYVYSVGMHTVRPLGSALRAATNTPSASQTSLIHHIRKRLRAQPPKVKLNPDITLKTGAKVLHVEVDPNPNPNPNPHPNPTIQPTRLIDRIRGGGCGGSSVKVSVYSTLLTLLSTLFTYATPPLKSLASSVVSGLTSMVKLDSGASEHILGHSLISEAPLLN